MLAEYYIEENDFLDYQLYTASKSSLIRKKRLRNKVLVPVVYLAFGLLFIYLQNNITAVMFSAVGVLWFFLYPLWERNRYVSYYRKYIRENHKERFGRKVSIRFEKDYIYTHDNGNEGKISTYEIEEINDIPKLILLKLKTGQSLIIPKNKIADLNDLIAGLKEQAVALKVRFNTEPEWKWK